MRDPLFRALAVLARPSEPRAAMLGGLFGGGSAPAPPPPPKPVPMPDLNDPAILAAKTQQLQAAAARSGRLSTILSGASGGDYSGQKLGAA